MRPGKAEPRAGDGSGLSHGRYFIDSFRSSWFILGTRRRTCKGQLLFMNCCSHRTPELEAGEALNNNDWIYLYTDLFSQW